MEFILPQEALVMAVAAGDEAAVLRSLTDLPSVEARFREALDALLADLAFVLRLAPSPLSAGAEVMLAAGTCASRDTLVLIETFAEQRREELVRDPAQFFSLLFDWFYWLDSPSDEPASRQRPHYDRWVERERQRRAASPGAPSPQLWLRRIPPAPLRSPPRPCFGIPGALLATSRDGRLLLVGCKLPLYERQQGWVLGGEIISAPARLAAYRGHDVALYALDRSEPVAQMTSPTEPIRALRFADRNRLVIAATSTTVHAWQSSDGALVGTATEGPLRQLLPMDHGPMILYHPEGCRLFDFKTTTPLRIKGPVPSQLTYTRDGKPETYQLSRDATVERRLVDGTNGRVLLGIVLGGRMQVESPSVLLSPDGARLIVWNRGRAQLWSTETLAPIAALPPFGDSINTAITDVEFSSDGELCFIANGDTLFWFAARDGEARGSLRFSGSDYVHLARAGARGVMVHTKHAWHVVDPASGTLGASIAADYVHAPLVSPAGDFVVIQGGSAIAVYSLPSGALRFKKATYSYEVTLAPDGAWLELPDRKGVRRFDARSGEELDQAAPAEVGSRVVAGRDDRIRVFAPTAARVSAAPDVPPEPRLPQSPVRFLADGRHLLTEHATGLRLWELSTGLPAQDWPGERVLLGVEAHGKPQRLLIARGDALVLRDLADGSELWSRPSSGWPIERAAFSSASGMIVVEGRGHVAVLDAESGQERSAFPDAKVQKLCAHHLVLTVGAIANTVIELASGRTIATVPGGASVLDVSADGAWILRLSGYDKCEIWQVALGAGATTFEYQGGSPRFLEAPLRVQTFESVSPQSGNTDTDTWREYEVPSGRLIATRSEDVSSYAYLDRARPSGPLGPGVSIEDGTWLVVDGSRLQLTSEQAVGTGRDGVIYVAQETASLFELFVVERSSTTS